MIQKKGYTKTVSQKQIRRSVRVIDAKGVSLGRLASQIAHILQGKDKVDFSYASDNGDYVVVINLKQVRISGAKPHQKQYGTYSGYPGGLRLETLESLLKRNPRELMRRAVKGMLPKNKLRDKRLSRLSAFVDEHYQLPALGLSVVASQ